MAANAYLVPTNRPRQKCAGNVRKAIDGRQADVACNPDIGARSAESWARMDKGVAEMVQEKGDNAIHQSTSETRKR